MRPPIWPPAPIAGLKQTGPDAPRRFERWTAPKSKRAPREGSAPPPRAAPDGTCADRPPMDSRAWTSLPPGRPRGGIGVPVAGRRRRRPVRWRDVGTGAGPAPRGPPSTDPGRPWQTARTAEKRSAGSQPDDAVKGRSPRHGAGGPRRTVSAPKRRSPEGWTPRGFKSVNRTNGSRRMRTIQPPPTKRQPELALPTPAPPPPLRCPVCGRTVRRRTDGRFYVHQRGSGQCPAGGLDPSEAERLVYQVRRRRRRQRRTLDQLTFPWGAE